jgi:hypothetical protein
VRIASDKGEKDAYWQEERTRVDQNWRKTAKSLAKEGSTEVSQTFEVGPNPVDKHFLRLVSLTDPPRTSPNRQQPPPRDALSKPGTPSLSSLAGVAAARALAPVSVEQRRITDVPPTERLGHQF